MHNATSRLHGVGYLSDETQNRIIENRNFTGYRVTRLLEDRNVFNSLF